MKRAIAAVWLICLACTPFPLVRSVASSNPGCLYYASPEEKLVALTIDDGPDSATTPRILDLLRENDAHATFFLISSRIAGNDSLVVRTLREGNEIGNHMSRNEASISLSPARYEQSLVEADSVLRRFAKPRWARPGSGFFSAGMLSTMKRHGYTCALGSVYPFDPQLPLAAHTTSTVLREVRKGSVIVLHDGGYKGRNTIRALSRLLPELRKRGYKVVALSDLVAAQRALPQGLPMP